MSVELSEHRHHWHVVITTTLVSVLALGSCVCSGVSQRRRGVLAAALGVDAEEGGSSDAPPNCGLPESMLLLPPSAPGRPTEVMCSFAAICVKDCSSTAYKMQVPSGE